MNSDKWQIGPAIAQRFADMDSGKPVPPSHELQVFTRLLDVLLSVPRDKIREELRRAHEVKATYGKVRLEGALSGNARRRDT